MSERCFSGNFRLNCFSILAVLCLLAPRLAHSQETETPQQVTNTTVEANTPGDTVTRVTPKPSGRQPVESEIAETGMITYGNFRVFGAAPRCNIWTAGVEYDRHSWGYHLKAQVDYVVEVLPFVVLSEPAKADFWGNPESPNQQLVHGVGLSPFGFRFLWRSNKTVKPFLIGKAGVIAFPQKILSPNASYANFNFQGDFGLQIRLTERTELRVDPLVYFHVSNGYFAASNPGFDQLGAKFGISYHLGKQGR
jgi:Lipid A 3-O-deacylase (PagL)